MIVESKNRTGLIRVFDSIYTITIVLSSVMLVILVVRTKDTYFEVLILISAITGIVWVVDKASLKKLNSNEKYAFRFMILLLLEFGAIFSYTFITSLLSKSGNYLLDTTYLWFIYILMVIADVGYQKEQERKSDAIIND